MASNGQGAIPAYQRIQGAIPKVLEAGNLKLGDAVDSERELARVHGGSLMTVPRSGWPGAGGIVERWRGAGTFVAGRVGLLVERVKPATRKCARMGCQGTDPQRRHGIDPRVRPGLWH